MKKYMKKLATLLAFCMFFTASTVNLSIAQEDTTVLVQDASSEVNELDKITEEIKEIVEEGNKIQEDEVSDIEESYPSIPEDVKARILADDKSTLYDTSTGVHPEGLTSYTEGEANKLTLSKTAENKGNDEYEIKLNITGDAQQQEIPTADIVIVIDRSNSMSDGGKLGKVKKGIDSFIKEILGTDVETSPTNVGISLVEFSNQADVLTATQDDNLNLISHPFTNDYDTLSGALNKINANGGTNTEAGINRAKQVLAESKADKKYVVFFTDGMPTYYCGEAGEWKITQTDKFPWFEHVWVPSKDEKEINKSNFGYDYLKGSGSYTTDNSKQAAKNAYDELINDNQGVKFYSVGLFDKSSNSTAVDFLFKIQNITTDTNIYKSNYYTNSSDKIVEIFKSLGLEISSDINELIATDVELYDIVTKYFTIPEATIPTITDFGSNALSINKGIEVEHTVDYESNKISLKIDKIKAPGITISFTVKAKDPYFYGVGIPTNVEAKITTFKDPLTPSKEGCGKFEVPTVSINPKKGSISVTKLIENQSGMTAPTDDKFSILIKKLKLVNNQNTVGRQYNMSVQSGKNNEQTMSFILIKEDTDLSYTSNHQATSQYAMLTVGNYTVDELVPMNYIKTSTTISTNANTNKVETNTFTLDKDSNIINIEITNKYVNDIYFFDKIIKSNIFNFMKLSS